MIVRSIDGNGDWNFGKGKACYLTEAQAIAQNIKTKILSFLNDCFFDMNAGIDWFNILGAKSKSDIQNAVIAQLNNCYGVSEITNLTTSFDEINRILTLSYYIKTIYDENINETLQLGGVYG